MLKNTNKINGWLVIDKPLDIGSTTVVSKLKWALTPQKIGHAGTLDPLATGVLPIALGYATKLIPFVMDGQKTYDFQVTWGAETTTDDRAGSVVQSSLSRPTVSDIESVLSRFTGVIDQEPPAYSALKINGKRAYDLARSGQAVILKKRPVRIDSLTLLKHDGDTSDFRVVCGKGTYVRSLGRDIGRLLGCLGHISVLRRLTCGPFSINQALPLSCFDTKNPTVSFLPIETALDHFVKLTLPESETLRLCQGQRLSRGSVQPYLAQSVPEDEILCLMCQDRLIGLVRFKNGTFHPYRIFQTKI